MDILDKKAGPAGGVAPGMRTSDGVEVNKGTILKEKKKFLLKNFLFKQPVH